MPLEPSLAVVEQQLEEVSAHLLTADPVALQGSSEDLRQAMAGLSEAIAHAHHAGQVLEPAIVQRLHTINTRLAAQRQGLARLAAAVDRQAAVVLPASLDEATYAHALGVRSASGAAARIYRSAG